MMSGMLHGEFGFIMMQPVAIMLEDGILAVGKRLGIKMNWAWRVLGYVWVASFIVWSGWQWFDAMELEDTWMWHALRPNLAKKAVERFLA